MTKTYSRKSNAKVFYRVFPIEKINESLVQLDKDQKTVYLRNQQELSRHKQKSTESPSYWRFDSDGIFLNASQSLVYDSVAENLLKQVFSGYDAVILGFGQTGSGKSVTTSGLADLPQDVGITPRLVNDLFKEKKLLAHNQKMLIEMSYIEYGRFCAFDLLKEYPNQVGYPYVMSRIKVRNRNQAFAQLYKGEGRREFILNNYMSHLYTSILTLFITMKQTDLEKPDLITSKIHIIDCAGVDCLNNATCSFKRTEDVGTGNIVKTELEQLLMALCRNDEGIRLRYRLNPVLGHLGKSLSNEAVLRFIGHINLSPENIKISLSLLRFGQLVKGLVMRQKVVNPGINPEVEVSYFKNELDKIKQERTLELLLSNQSPGEIDADRIEQIQISLMDYLKGEKNLEDFLLSSDVPTTLKLFKDIYSNFENEKNAIYKDAYNSAIEEMSPFIDRNAEEEETKASTTEKLTSRSTLKSRSSSKRSGLSVESKSKQVILEPRPSERSVKKKSTTSIGSKGDSKTLPNYMIPEKVVEFQEAWIKYISDKTTKYERIIEEYKNNESDILQAYLAYLEQVALTRELKKIVQLREKELFELQLLLKLDDSPNVSLERQLHNLKCAKDNYLVQHEKMLACKSNFLAHLSLRENLKKYLSEDFDQYCTDNFNTITENNIEDVLEYLTTDLNAIEAFEEEEEDECAGAVHRKEDKLPERLRKFKKLMNKEIERKKKYKQTHKSLIKL